MQTCAASFARRPRLNGLAQHRHQVHPEVFHMVASLAAPLACEAEGEYGKVCA
jgi:hypothetical protein